MANNNINAELQAAFDAGNYSQMASMAKGLGLFTGNAPKKPELAAIVDKYLSDHVDIDNDADMSIVVDSGSNDFMPHTPSDRGWEDESDNSSAGVSFDPKPTGKGGGNGEFYYWPLTGKYAAMQNGKPCEPMFDKEMWDVVSPALPNFTDLKPALVKAAKKAAEATKYQYSVTVTFTGCTFESTDPELAASELSWGTLMQQLDYIGVAMPDEVKFNIVKGKAKSSGGGGRSTAGEGSGFYTATQRSELRPLNTVQKQILQAAASIDGCPLSDYAKYGRQDSIKLGNVCIEFKKKGYGDAIRRQNGAIFFDAGAMYEGYELSHSLAI